MIKITPLVTRLLVWSFMFFGLFASAQTEAETQKITASYDKAYLQDLAAQALEKSTREKKEAVAYAQARNIPITYTTKDGAYAELQKVLPDGTLIYYQTDNKDAARSTRVNHLNTGGSTGYNLDGQNMIAYVWDGGHPRVSHQEYDGPGGNNRVSIMDASSEGGTKLNFHAAHVAGTIMASGVVAQAKGMAPHSKVRAYKWNNDLSEATAAASGGMLLSNHSYGYGAEGIPVQWFGAYREDARNWDNLMFNAPYFLMVNSAGNDGEDTHLNTSPIAPGYDMLNGMSTAKNNLVIAAANDALVDNNGNLVSVSIAGFSSQGPTDDLRIKPDIAGNGVDLTSTYSSSNTAYGTISGTSMSSPNVTGSLLLLQQHYNNLNGNFMHAATLKGLALHTADDAGPTGPDAVWGWGLLNTKRAAETITLNGSGSLIQERVISQGQTITLTVNADGINALMASISWTDRPGVVNNTLNSSTAALVNDLDIRVEKGGAIYFPWRLTAYNANAKNGDNKKDPFERVDVANASGTYSITITHKGTLVGGSQKFSLIVTGLEISCFAATVPQNVRNNGVTATTVDTSWDMVPGALYDLRYRKIGAPSWMEVSDLTVNDYILSALRPTTNYEFQVRSKCPVGATSAYSAAVSFSTLANLAYCESGSLTPGADLYNSRVKLSTINETSSYSSYSDFTNVSTELVAGQTYSISITATASGNYQTSYSVWIDYNRNESFDDFGEQVFTMMTGANTVATGSFTVPTGIIPLTTRMRVSMTNDPTPAGPCDSFNFGEVEDYTIHLNRTHIDYVYQNESWSPTNPAGVCTSVDNIHVINGTAEFTTDISAYNITIEAGATLNVAKILTISGDLTNNGNLVFVSGPAGNGELASVPHTSEITGNATVQRYMSGHRAYRMVSSAVTTTTSIHDNWQEGANSNTHDPDPGYGTHITGSTIDQHNGFDGTLLGNPSMFIVNVETQQFAAVPNTNVRILEAGEPYLMYVRGDRSIDLMNNNAFGETVLRATGALYYGKHKQDFSTANPGNFVMFGNPYQSAVDITSVFAHSTNLYPEFYYIYDPTLADNGSYVIVDLSEGSNNFPGSAANQFLQPGQAAQVRVSGAASVIFNESDKSPGSFTATNANPMFGNDKLTVQLYTAENFNNEGPAHDGLMIRFADGYDNGLTPHDAIKSMNFYENLGIDHNGTYLGIERREMPQNGEIYSLYSAGYQHTEYTLKLRVDGLDASDFYLEDYYAGTSTLLEAGDTAYNFHIVANDPLSKATNRFSIRTNRQLAVGDNNLLSLNIHLFPNPISDNTFYIAASKLNGETVNISINDMLGREVYNNQQTFSENTVKVNLATDLKSGVYMATISYKGERQSLRVIKK